MMSQDQGARYRQAAEDALEQLDWCIGYLHGIRKGKISMQLARNRAYIRRNLLREADERLPSQVTPNPEPVRS
jgi:hypothetical protein